MTSDLPEDVARRFLLDRYTETGNQKYLELARQIAPGRDLRVNILLAEDRQLASRPAADDFAPCVEMASLVLEQGLTGWAAARQVTAEDPERLTDYEHSIAKRRYRKFGEKRDLYVGTAGAIITTKARRQAIDQALDQRRAVNQIVESSPGAAFYRLHKSRRK